MPAGISGETFITNTTFAALAGEGNTYTSVMSAEVFDRVARL